MKFVSIERGKSYKIMKVKIILGHSCLVYTQNTAFSVLNYTVTQHEFQIAYLNYLCGPHQACSPQKITSQCQLKERSVLQNYGIIVGLCLV